MSDSAPHPDADEAWEDLLRQWQTGPEAQPRPYFYSRVRARIAQQTVAERPSVQAWLRWPAYAVLLSLLLLSGDDTAGNSTSEVKQHSRQSETGFGGN